MENPLLRMVAILFVWSQGGNTFTLTAEAAVTAEGTAYTIVAYLDRVTVYDRILKDDVTIAQFLQSFTLAQITEFIKAAIENNCTNVTAILLDYQQQKFSDFDPMDEFSLEL